MYKKGIYKILTNEPLTDAVWRMTLAGDTQWISAPGQFVNIALEGKYLRRPISICDYDDRSIALIYKVVGGGTEQMSRMLPGETLDLLTGLGNGFSTKNDARRPLLVGGGVGVPPLYNLAKKLLAEGKPVQVVLGFNTASEVFYEEEFRAAARSPSRRSTVRGASGASSRRPSPNGGWISITFTPAGRCRCSMRSTTPWSRTASCRSKSAWGADSAPAWAVRAKPNTATNVSARRGRSLPRMKSSGKNNSQFIIQNSQL